MKFLDRIRQWIFGKPAPVVDKRTYKQKLDDMYALQQSYVDQFNQFCRETNDLYHKNTVALQTLKNNPSVYFDRNLYEKLNTVHQETWVIVGLMKESHNLFVQAEDFARISGMNRQRHKEMMQELKKVYEART